MPVQVLRRSFSVDEYYRMADAGILGGDDRVELIEGQVLEMGPIGSRHAACVKRLIELFSSRAAGRALVSAQDPVRLGERSEPQPDIALLEPRDDYYAEAHPRPGQVLLLVEVAEASLEFDRDVKLPLYARAAVPETWIVDLEGDRILEAREPGPDGYRQVRSIGRGQKLGVHTLPGLELSADEVLGRERPGT